MKILELQAPPHYRTHFGKRLVSYEDNPPDPVILRFKDDTTAQCDMLVGADGIRSAVRRTMFTQLADHKQDETYLRYVDAKWTGIVIYRSLISKEALEAEYPNHMSLLSSNYVSDTDTGCAMY